MQELSISEYKNLVRQTTPLSSERVDGQICHKVLQLPDQSILKLFRIKRLLTTARFVPYAKRFQRNVARLEALGIPTLAIRAVYKIPAIQRTAVHYSFMSGITIRECCEKEKLDAHLAQRMGHFFAFLHQQGTYFRSIHFGNMVLTPDNRIGLIDVGDMRFRRGPLNLRMRMRNLRHLFRYEFDIDCLAHERNVFMNAYCATARLDADRESRLRRHFDSYFQKDTRRIVNRGKHSGAGVS